MVKNMFDFLVTAIETENWEHVSLENVSSDYYHASQKAENYYEKIKEILPPEMHETLLRLDDERNQMENAVTDVYYRQGFSDALRLILQAMLWEPGRG
ncbi:methylphosphotriester-DNA--protein-cysteine methyltransferase [Sporomusaceae bacterium BoRhaA]|uniref:hypothetical protein n=1 Tax=Pelorhabdus rhamnosifermentans TaxID=2772457 RepID=UPI001C05F26F|nr:hypothetical protein [Pelorhabdus rhamnosifermentans]MBU2703364.1 methylphosphotriester-DNA--protein-cysteine methyltransferase [Pelorhabdus rhamnosifermentans]